MKTKRFTKRMITVLLMALISVMMVFPANAATKVKLNYSQKTIVVGQKVNLKVKGTSSKVKWSSSNKSIATVSSKGVVTAKKAGAAKIKATVKGKTYTCKLTVKKNSWKYQGNIAWIHEPFINRQQAINMVRARPVQLSYNSKGQLTVKIVVLNDTPGRNYTLSKMRFRLTSQSDNKTIAEGWFAWNNCVIRPMAYEIVTITFNNNQIKKVVNLNKDLDNLRYNIETN